MDLGTRQLRYFVVVAEELNFTRAAQRLSIAQQALSAQVSQFEERLGVKLLARTTRKVELTAAGEVFFEEAKRILTMIDRAVVGAQNLHKNDAATLRVGLHLGGALELTVAILGEFRRRHPNVRLELIEGRLEDPTMGLADYLVDVAIVRPPLSNKELRYAHLFSEPRILMVGRQHPLAAQEKVSLEQALKEPFVGVRCNDQVFVNFWTLAKYREGEQPVVDGVVGTVYEELQTVAEGRACTVVSAGYARFSAHPGVTFLPFEDDIDPTTCAVSWRSDTSSRLIHDFVTSAVDVCKREEELVRAIENPFEFPPAAVALR